MSKVFCFIIALLMLLGGASSLIASEVPKDASSCFEEFVTDQIYKNFSATISAKHENSSQSSSAVFTEALNTGSSQLNFSDNRYSGDNKTILKNYHSCFGAVLFYCDIWRHRTRHSGLSEYIMNLNSFIAVSTVSDAIVYYKAV